MLAAAASTAPRPPARWDASVAVRRRVHSVRAACLVYAARVWVANGTLEDEREAAANSPAGSPLRQQLCERVLAWEQATGAADAERSRALEHAGEAYERDARAHGPFTRAARSHAKAAWSGVANLSWRDSNAEAHHFATALEEAWAQAGKPADRATFAADRDVRRLALEAARIQMGGSARESMTAEKHANAAAAEEENDDDSETLTA